MAKRPDVPNWLAQSELGQEQAQGRGAQAPEASVRERPGAGPGPDATRIDRKAILRRRPTLHDWQVVMGQLRDALRKIAESELVRSDPKSQRIICAMVGRPIKDVKVQMDRLELRVNELLAERRARAAKAQAAKKLADKEAAIEAAMAEEIKKRGERRVLQAVNTSVALHREDADGERRRMLLRL